MAKHGEKKHKKRIATPKNIPISDKKEYTFFPKVSPGPYKAKEAIPLKTILVEFLKIAKTGNEAKKVIKEGKVKVDGKIRKDERYPVGLMAIIEIPDGKYRLILKNKKLTVEQYDGNEKIVKVVNKYTGKNNIIYVTTMDGRNIKADNHIKVGDSLILEDGKLKKHLKFEKGAKCLITAGKHAGIEGILEEIKQHGRKKDAILAVGDDKIITRADYLMVVA